MNGDPLAPIHPPLPVNTERKVSLLNRTTLGGIVLSIIAGVTTAGIPAWIGRNPVEPTACVEVVRGYRSDLAGNPARLNDYLDPGADGNTVLSRDKRAAECGIDEQDLKRYAAEDASVSSGSSSEG